MQRNSIQFGILNSKIQSAFSVYPNTITYYTTISNSALSIRWGNEIFMEIQRSKK